MQFTRNSLSDVGSWHKLIQKKTNKTIFLNKQKSTKNPIFKIEK